MAEQLLSYWDDTLKKYVEVSSTTPLPTNAVGGGAGGAEEVEITSANGAATTAQGNADGRAATDIGLMTNSRNYHFNGTTWDRTQGGAYAAGANSTSGTYANARLLAQDGNAATNSVMLQAFPAGSDALLAADILLQTAARQVIFNGTTWDRARSVQAAADAYNGVGLSAEGIYGFNGTTWDRIQVVSPTDNATQNIKHLLTMSRNQNFNGVGWDRQYNNQQGTLLASAARTATNSTPTQTNYNARGVTLFLNVTANPGGAETLVLELKYVDPVTGNASLGFASADVPAATNGMFPLVVYPGVVNAPDNPTNNTSYSLSLPRQWQASVVHSGAGSWTYSLGYSLTV